jgi:hypothetical protein
MRRSRFEPTVQRNRFTTNWVAASQLCPKSRGSTLKGSVLLGVIALLIAIPVASAQFYKEPDRQERRSVVALRPPMTECSVESVRAWLLSGKESSKGLAMAIVTAAQEFGGLRSEKYQCTSRSGTKVFQALWALEERAWTLKEISRPSDDEPGDL